MLPRDLLKSGLAASVIAATATPLQARPRLQSAGDLQGCRSDAITVAALGGFDLTFKP